MIRRSCRTFVLALMLLCGSALSTHRTVAADGTLPAGAEQDPARIEEWVRQLDDSRFAVRQRASRELLASGLPALEQLAGALNRPSREAHARALAILKVWSVSRRQQLAQATVATLRRLAEQTDSPGAAHAAQLLAWHRDEVVKELTGFFAAREGQVNARTQPHGRAIIVQLTSAWSGSDEDLDRLGEFEELTWLSMQNAPVSNRALMAISRCKRLEQLYLGQTRITVEGLRYLGGLPNLKYLSLQELRVGDDALDAIAPLTQLESLGLDGTQITNQGLEQLKSFPALRVLWLDSTLITGDGLVHLKSNTRLNKLFLSDTQTGGDGLRHLAELPELFYLSLKDNQLTDEGVMQLARLSKLTTLGLDETNLTDDMLKHFSGHPNLETLWLSKTEVTDDCLQYLKQMPALKTLYLHGSQITKAGAERIRLELPYCAVHY